MCANARVSNFEGDTYQVGNFVVITRELEENGRQAHNSKDSITTDMSIFQRDYIG